MPWLVHEGRVLASLEIADTRSARRRGLLGRDRIDGAMLLRPARSVHTVKMRFAIDVAHIADAHTEPDDEGFVVLSVTTMRPGRFGRWSPRASGVIEAEAGSFRAWGLEPGMRLEIRE
ncbi:MAG: DUF192 domain-containing protein [Actinomycetota bacterium]